MSYCRCGPESDVYAYRTGGDLGEVFVIHVGDDTFEEPNRQAFLARMLALREAGYLVPEGALVRIRHEIATGKVQYPFSEADLKAQFGDDSLPRRPLS